MHRVEITPEARKQLAKLPENVRRRVAAKIAALADNPRPPGVVFLHGSLQGLYRIRSGDYRVIYQVHDDRLVVLVVRIGNRREVYE